MTQPDAGLIYTDAQGILADLVAFDTTSRDSNLALIAYVRDKLLAVGVEGTVIPSPDGRKGNFLACVGPLTPGGVVLSGHTDVVPVDGQPWTSDPFRLTLRDERFYGRGTCDMKGFVALALALALRVDARALKRPVHLAFSYDEEVGCLGAPALIETLAARGPAPSAVIVGEPTDMQAVSAHKGLCAYRIKITGKEAHSSQTHLGISAVMEAVPILQTLRSLADGLKASADPLSPFTPKESTLTIGLVNGGTAGNILAGRCDVVFDLRCAHAHEPDPLVATVAAQVQALDEALKARDPGAGATFEQYAAVPPLEPEPNGVAEHLARRLAGDNGPFRAVAYAAEAGQFRRAGFSTVICGPGCIDQAHQADEYVTVDQMRRGAAFMARLAEDLQV